MGPGDPKVAEIDLDADETSSLEGEPSPSDGRERSSIATELERLKTSTIEAAAKRERLPQPLFWSLFHSVISEVREKKRAQRVVDELLGK